MSDKWRLTGTAPNGIEVEIIVGTTGYIHSFTPETAQYITPVPDLLNGFSNPPAHQNGLFTAIDGGVRPGVDYDYATEHGVNVQELQPHVSAPGGYRTAILHLKIKSFVPVI